MHEKDIAFDHCKGSVAQWRLPCACRNGMAANLRQQYEAAQEGANTVEKGTKPKTLRPKKEPAAKQSQGENRSSQGDISSKRSNPVPSRQNQGPSRASEGDRAAKREGSAEKEYPHRDEFVPGRPFQPQKQRRDRRMAGQRQK